MGADSAARRLRAATVVLAAQVALAATAPAGGEKADEHEERHQGNDDDDHVDGVREPVHHKGGDGETHAKGGDGADGAELPALAGDCGRAQGLPRLHRRGERALPREGESRSSSVVPAGRVAVMASAAETLSFSPSLERRTAEVPRTSPALTMEMVCQAERPQLRRSCMLEMAAAEPSDSGASMTTPTTSRPSLEAPAARQRPASPV